MTKRGRRKPRSNAVAGQSPANPEVGDNSDNPTTGYGRPPVKNRFKPGHSGNPRGRPKNSRNLKTIIQQALTGRITVREGEKRRSITKIEGVVLRQVEGALKGNDRAALATLRIAAQVGLLDDVEAGFEAYPLSRAEQQMVQELLTKTPEQRRGGKGS
jgi:hypothetical protein